MAAGIHLNAVAGFTGDGGVIVIAHPALAAGDCHTVQTSRNGPDIHVVDPTTVSDLNTIADCSCYRAGRIPHLSVADQHTVGVSQYG